MRLLLRSGDVVILGGAARLAYHGLDRIVPGSSNPVAADLVAANLIPGDGRFNLTLRRVNVP